MSKIQTKGNKEKYRNCPHIIGLGPIFTLQMEFSQTFSNSKNLANQLALTPTIQL